MKTIKFFAVAAIVVACNGQKEESKENVEETTAIESVETPQEINEAGLSADLVSAYINLKDALIETSVEKASEAAKVLKSQFEESEVSGEAVEAVDMLSTADDVEVQRTHFKTVTDNLIPLIKEKGVESTLYVQFCPMAFDNTGAVWISNTEEVLNPYFGDKMLKCGKVQETLN